MITFQKTDQPVSGGALLYLSASADDTPFFTSTKFVYNWAFLFGGAVFWSGYALNSDTFGCSGLTNNNLTYSYNYAGKWGRDIASEPRSLQAWLTSSGSTNKQALIGSTITSGQNFLNNPIEVYLLDGCDQPITTFDFSAFLAGFPDPTDPALARIDTPVYIQPRATTSLQGE